MELNLNPATAAMIGLDWVKVGEGVRKMASFMARLPRIEKVRDEARALLGVTPSDVVYQEHSITVKRYHVDGPRRGRPVLCVPSLVNRSWILDLLPGDSLVEWLAQRGHDVYMLDWGIPNPGQAGLSLAYYLDHYIDRVVKRVLRVSGASEIDLLGYCLGGTMSAMYLALHPEAPIRTFTAMTTPVNFQDRGILSWWARPGHIDVDKLVETSGNIPESFFRTTFPWIVPTASTKKLRTIYDRHDDEAFLRHFLALDIWITENVPFPGQVYRQVITDLYQKNRLMDDSLVMDGRPCRLGDIRQPTLNFAAKFDHVAPVESCQVLSEKITTPGSRLEVLKAGHLGPALGRDASGAKTQDYWRTLAHWLEA